MAGTNESLVGICLTLDEDASISVLSGPPWLYADRVAKRYMPTDKIEIGAVTHVLSREQTLHLLRELVDAFYDDAEAAIIQAGATAEYLKERIREEVS